jgi:hypothetical protein
MSALEKFSEEQEIEFYHSANDVKDAIRKYGIEIVAFCMNELAEEQLSKLEENFDLTTATHSGTMVIQ